MKSRERSWEWHGWGVQWGWGSVILVSLVSLLWFLPIWLADKCIVHGASLMWCCDDE